MREYKKIKEQFLAIKDECEIMVPEPGVCTYSALVVHHMIGRENERLLDTNFWLASCPGCNIWIETSAGTRWAYENGKKLYKHQLNNLDNENEN